MAFIRRIKKKSGVYLAKVESYRENGKVKQRVVKYLGREVNNKPVRRVSTLDLELVSVRESLNVQVIHHLAKQLSIGDLENKNWLVLAYSHLLESCSINKLTKWIEHTEIPQVLDIDTFSSTKLYDSLAALGDIDFSEIEKRIFGILSRFEKGKKAAIIDVTDTYFEGKNGSQTKRRRGKDHKVRKLIQIGLAVTPQFGFPIMHQTYEGNLSDKCVFKDMALTLKRRNISSVIMDRGFLSSENLIALLRLKLQTIAGLSKTPTLINQYIAKTKKKNIYQLANRVELKNTAVYIKSFSYKKGTLIVCYNPKTELIKKEQAYNKGKVPKYDEYLGYSLIYHNTTQNNADIVKQYYDKDTVERAFKQLKGVLNIRPIRVWLNEHIKSHIKICYLSYAILTLLRYKTRKIMSPIQALETLKHGYRATIKDKKNKHEWQINVPLQSQQQKILKATGCSV